MRFRQQNETEALEVYNETISVWPHVASDGHVLDACMLYVQSFSYTSVVHSSQSSDCLLVYKATVGGQNCLNLVK